MPTIALTDATVRAPGPEGDVTILRPTTLTLTERRIALIGANGSGKSTLARLLNGLIEPSEGSVKVDGLDTRTEGAAVRRTVGFLFTDPAAQLVMPTVAEDIALSLRRQKLSKAERRARTEQLLAEFGLADKADVSVHSLSGGQRQLLALLSVLAAEPEILVADEPTTLLDLRNTRRIADLLFSLRQQLVLVTHDLDLAARCERVLVVDDACVVFDGPAEQAVAHYTESVT